MRKIFGMGLVALILATMSCSNAEFDKTADQIGNNDGQTSKEEKGNLNTIIKIAKQNKSKFVYQPFIIFNRAEIPITPAILGDKVPDNVVEPYLVIRSDNRFYGFNENEANNSHIPSHSQEFHRERLYNIYELLEIDHSGKITGKYLFRRSGMEKQ